MDLLPKTIINIRSEVRSSVYRTALKSPFGCCFGFLLGSLEPLTSPAIEFSLVSGIPKDINSVWSAPQKFKEQLSACQQVAEHTGMTLFGLFAAWDSTSLDHYHQFVGLFIDIAKEMQLRYVAEFSTTAHEPLWAPSIYFANRFPHEALSYRTLHGKLSVEPRHNPRRVRALWHNLILPDDEDTPN